MSAAAEIARRLVAAGTPVEEVAELMADLAVEMAARKRSAGAERTARWRERHKASQSVTCDAPAAPPSSPPSPYSSPTPPIITPSTPPSPGSEPSVRPTVVGENDRARLFREGKTLLASFGVAERRTGALIGQWLKLGADPEGLLAAITFARDQNVAEPVAYISTLVHGKFNGKRPKTLAEACDDLIARAENFDRQKGLIRDDNLL